MYKIYWRGEISYAHKLKLDYESKCNNLHGHNGLVEIWQTSNKLNKNGMVVDFTHLKKIVMKYDHIYLNDISGLEQPTSERTAKLIYDDIRKITDAKTLVRIWEDKDSYSEYGE